MSSFANLGANLKLNIQDFSSKLRQAANMTEKFAADMNGKTVQSMKELNKQTNAWGLNLKSVSRVVSGILISQAFYAMLRSIREATTAVLEFAQELEYAKIAYSNLFGDTELAQEFINVLKEFAAVSPFSFTDSEKAAKRLLAYGIEYKNVMYVMQGVMAAASAQGDPTKIESISRAIGQIYTYGKLMTAEVRQLTEAGIPVYDILQEKLGLTQEQLRNLGNEAIPASTAINALIDGINERFGNVLTASSKTLKGIISNIKDNAVMIGSSLIEPMVVIIKSALSELGGILYNLREILDTQGIGGMLEAMFPPEMHALIRQFVANFQTLLQAVLRLGVALGGFLRPIAEALMRVFNAFSPIIVAFANVLSAAVLFITQNATAMKYLTAILAGAAAMWVVYKVKALATAVVTTVINGMTAALAGLATMLTFVVKHPFWALLIGLTGILVGISGGFGAISEKINGFFKNLTKFNGVDPDKVLLPSQEERASDLGKFNEKLEGTSDAMDDLADSTGKATKAAKGLLSFDEVFKLNEPDEGTGNGIDVDGLEDMFEGIGGLGDAYIPEVPDFSEYMNNLMTGFLEPFKSLWGTIKEYMSEIIGGAIGAAIGGLLGGPFGAVIGALLGALAGNVWDRVVEAFGISPEQELATLISAGIMGAFKASISLIRGLIKGLVPTFTNGVFSGFSRMVGFSFRDTLKGALKQGILGAIVGLGVGLLANALTGWLAQEFDLTEQDLANSGVGQTIGSIVGSIVGLILGGPIGSLVGGALGQLAGAIVGEFWAYLSTTLKGTIIGGVAGLPIGALVGTIVGSIGGPLGAGLGAAVGAALGTLIGLITEHWSSIASFFSGIGQTIADGFNGLVGTISSFVDDVVGFFSEMLNSMSGTFSIIGTVVSDVMSGVMTVVTDIMNGISTVLTDIWSAITTVITDIANAVYTVTTTVHNTVSNVLSFIRDLAVKVFTDIWNALVTWFSPIAQEISRVCSEAWNHVSSWFTNMYNTVRTIVNNVLSAVTTVFRNIANTIYTNVSNAWRNVSTLFTNMYNTVRTVATNLYNAVSQVFSNLSSAIREAISNAYSFVTNAFSNMYSGVKNSISSMYETVKNGISNIYTTFKNWISNMWENVFGKFFGWIDDAIEGLREFFGLEEKAKSSSSTSTKSSSYSSEYGHATGGIFNREHIARFAEGNKAEAIIPLEEQSAMQPFVDAVANGLTQSLAPMLASLNFTASQNQAQQLQPLYVGTLIADERSLKELERRMEIIRIKELKR